VASKADLNLITAAIPGPNPRSGDAPTLRRNAFALSFRRAVASSLIHCFYVLGVITIIPEEFYEQQAILDFSYVDGNLYEI
jgi:hypothetical protein